MAGLLEWMNTPAGQGLLSGVASYAMNARRGTPVNNLGRGLAGGITGYAQANDQIRQDKEKQLADQYRQMQMDQMRQSMEAQKAQQGWRAGLPSVMAPKLTGTTDQGRQLADQNAAFGAEGVAPLAESAAYAQPDAPIGVQYGQDKQAVQDYMIRPESPYADKLIEQQLFPKAADYKTVGNTLVKIGPDGVTPAFTAPKEQSLPGAVQEYQFATSQGYPGTFDQWKKDNARAGATNVTNRIDNKVGESIAAQVGPMLKSSTEKTTGAINLANSSRLMLEALDRGSAYVGPTANARLKLAQFGQVLGVGGKDEEAKINNTRQLIRSLAEGGVEARKELAGQGQVTESEAEAVQKAYSGNIEDLTVSEIRLIAGLNIKREKLARQRHGRALQNAPAQLQPFYQVDPEAPANPGSGWGIQKVE